MKRFANGTFEIENRSDVLASINGWNEGYEIGPGIDSCELAICTERHEENAKIQRWADSITDEEFSQFMRGSALGINRMTIMRKMGSLGVL